ncbi:AMP-binding protein [Streptomyces sedi]|uniref:AMP-binding protein n=1 Tax=Streptomyces sedi TaxID=555059 RepID=A0A5C4UR51_9ACTN|nr:AMP-binding protein [Streptomyces sedi]TNM25753.1 AMP-binding protein [Streptomyces sedi]
MPQHVSDFHDLPHAVRAHAATRAADAAVVFVHDPDDPEGATRLAYGELDAWARAIAATLSARHPGGARVLLLFPPGAAFAAGFLGCLYAGMVAVPAPLPDGSRLERRRVAGIAEDSGAAAVLTVRDLLPVIADWLTESGNTRPGTVAVDTPDALADADAWREPHRRPGDIAVLQYTSGSTGAPKGVAVTHAAIAANIRHMRDAYRLDATTPLGGWLPTYHDMGLFGTLAPALFLGTSCTLLSPVSFLKRPQHWLRMIDRHGIAFSAAPNFAFDVCARRIKDSQLVGLDLSRWRWAANGSEPVQAATLRAFRDRFASYGLRADALAPSYGLAEATVFVSRSAGMRDLRVSAAALERHTLRPAAPGEPYREIVSCGRPTALETRIVEPGGTRPLPPGDVGELLLRGESVCAGYWRNDEETRRVFSPADTPGGRPWLRTGDLAAEYDDELYVTGRIKETLIVHGRNLYPQDIEHELRLHHPELGHAGAAFTVPAQRGAPANGGQAVPDDESLVVAHETGPGAARMDLDALAVALRRTAVREFGIGLAAVALLSPGSVPRTTSGKVRRGAMRELFLNGELRPLHTDAGWRRLGGPAARPRPAAGEPTPRRPLTVRGLETVLRTAARDENAPLHPAHAAALDRHDAFPEDACRLLDQAGLAHAYVPAAHGGDLDDYAHLVQLTRAVARHDLTVAVAHAKTFLGSVPVWVAGRPEQAARLAERVRAGAVVSWALTEHGHGSDLLSTGTTAEQHADQWRLTGEKWLINNASRADLITVLARTGPSAGPRDLTLFLVDRRTPHPDTLTPLPKEPTLGIRGADISGIALRGASVPDSAVVGRPGHGLDAVLRSLQLTRTLCGALSLGAADHALRLAFDYATSREIHGTTLSRVPPARRALGDAVAALLLAEAVTAVGARSAHELPEELSVTSCVVKALVPGLVQSTLGSLGELLGARGFLADLHEHGAFAKLERDHRIVEIFDGTTAVCRATLVGQFPWLARGWHRRRTDDAGLRAVTSPGAPTPLDPARLRIVSHRGASLTQALPALVARVTARAAAGQEPPELLRAAQALLAAAEAVHAELARHQPTAGPPPAWTHDAARRYELCFAGAACLALRDRHHDTEGHPDRDAEDDARDTGAVPGVLAADALWARAALSAARAGLGEPDTDPEAVERLAALWSDPAARHSLFAGPGSH